MKNTRKLLSAVLRLAVGADPPELAPVLFVVIDEQGDVRVLADVADAAEVRRGLGLVVDRDVDPVVFVDCERDRDQVRAAAAVGRREPRHARVGEPVFGLRVGKLHNPIIVGTIGEGPVDWCQRCLSCR